jgi:transposase
VSQVALGIDIAQATFVAALWHGDTGQELGTFPNTPDGFAQWLQTTTQATGSPPGEAWSLVLEPTGGYELALALFAYEHGIRVSRPNPKQVRDFARGLGQRAKTDRLDALLLARYAAERKPPRWAPLAEEVSELESLLERQRELEEMLGQERRRQQALSRRPGIAAHLPDSLKQVIESLEGALKEVEEAIREQLERHPTLQAEAKQLQQVPGVGARNVLWLLVLVRRWHTLTQGQGSAKGLVALAGLDPRTHESGTSVRGRGRISRMGDRRLRPRLYMGALGGVKGNNALRTFYQRLVKKGKAKKLALVACARKILVWAWAVYRDKTEFRKSACQAEPAA